MNSENVVPRLELIAAKAKQLAQDEKANKLYPDELRAGLGDLSAQIARAIQEVDRG